MGKRGNGEGSISRRKGGGWMGQYVVHTADGSRKRRTVYGKTRAEVASKLAKALSQREDGFVFDDGGLTVEKYLGLWLENSVRDHGADEHLRAQPADSRPARGPGAGPAQAQVPGRRRRFGGSIGRSWTRASAAQRCTRCTSSCTRRSARPCGDGLIPPQRHGGGEGPAGQAQGDRAPLGRGDEEVAGGGRRSRGPLRGPVRPGRDDGAQAGRTACPQVGRCGPGGRGAAGPAHAHAGQGQLLLGRAQDHEESPEREPDGDGSGGVAGAPSTGSWRR